MTLTKIAVFQAECPECDSKMTYGWGDTYPVVSDGVGERRIDCPLCTRSIRHDAAHKTGYQDPPLMGDQ